MDLTSHIARDPQEKVGPKEISQTAVEEEEREREREKEEKKPATWLSSFLLESPLYILESTQVSLIDFCLPIVTS